MSQQQVSPHRRSCVLVAAAAARSPPPAAAAARSLPPPSSPVLVAGGSTLPGRQSRGRVPPSARPSTCLRHSSRPVPSAVFRPWWRTSALHGFAGRRCGHLPRCHLPADLRAPVAEPFVRAAVRSLPAAVAATSLAAAVCSALRPCEQRPAVRLAVRPLPPLLRPSVKSSRPAASAPPSARCGRTAAARLGLLPSLPLGPLQCRQGVWVQLCCSGLLCSYMNCSVLLLPAAGWSCFLLVGLPLVACWFN